MANGFQSREIDPVSVSALNSTGTDIPKGTIVKRDSTQEQIVVSTGVLDAFLGVTGEPIPNGSFGRVVTRGIVPTIFSAAQTIGARLTTSAGGKAVAAAAGNALIGVAVEAGASDVLAELELHGPGGTEMPG